MSVSDQPTVTRIVAWIAAEELGEKRRARLLWSDGSASELAWYDDEILICEGDLVGRSATQIRSTLFRRDRDYLQGEQR